MKNIILCGSMKVKNDILNICKLLQNMKYNVLLPTECMQGIEKPIASRAHFDRICDEKNDTILVVNSKKDNIDNYIGPNTFAEIALGFYFNKDIYLLNDIYEPYKDELNAWNVEVLHGNLESLK